MILRTPDQRFTGLPDFDFDPHYVEVADPWQGRVRMHYLDEGRPDGRPVVLIHGEPTWSFMFRHSIKPLADAGNRVIVPDLIGFGRSDKHADRAAYTYASHVAWLKGFFAELGLRECTVVGHDWGGLLSLRVATESPGYIGAYVATNHGYPTGDMPANDALRTWQEFAATTPVFETGAIVARACATTLSDEVVRAYDAPYPDESYKEGARAFPAIIPVNPDDPSSEPVRTSRAVLAESQMPFLTIYGEQDAIAGQADAMFQQLVPGANGREHVRLSEAGHNMPEDAGDVLGELVAKFVAELR